MGFRALMRRDCAVVLGAALALSAAPAALAAPGSATRAGAGVTAAPLKLTDAVSCVSADPANAALATQMAADITAQIAARPSSSEGISIIDSQTQITCKYRSTAHFYAASVIKAFILAALLRKAQEAHRSLTATEKYRAYYMITISDNMDASLLWNEIGTPYGSGAARTTFRQHFLNLAGMTNTQLKPAWGLSLLTADDEIKLLTLLTSPNTVLTPASQAYELGLMAAVTKSQRWGTPVGAPASVVVHVKNGWLPYPGTQWEINSIGAFTTAATGTKPARVYLMAILTYNNPTMAYGVTTIESISKVIHHDLNQGAAAVIAPTKPNASWGKPDGSKTTP